MSPTPRGLRAFLEERTGWSGALRAQLEERIPGGARWAYVFGSALVFLLLAQFCTGLALALSYSASVPAAWASVARLEQSGLGHLVRALHAHGATFLLGVCGLHLFQTALSGAYRAPREVTWWLGLALLAMLLVFCLTGSLLPFDERGYWATRVTLGVAATAPLVGPAVERMLAGGHELGNLTLTRFYATHAIVLPLLLVAFSVAHVAAMRRHGVTPLSRTAPDEAFWPRQALYDAAFTLLLFAALLGLSLARGAVLQGPADPAGAASPRPEWYFRPLFELLKLMPPGFEAVGAIALPGLAAAFLVALPFLDRSARNRKPVLAALFGGALAAAGLGVASYRADARSSQFGRGEALAAARAQKALHLAQTLGVPAGGALALVQDQPDERGARLFSRACAECHSARGSGGDTGPRLSGYLSRAWIRAVLVNPDGLYGNAKISGMESYQQLGDEKLEQLTSFLYALRSRRPDEPALESSRRLFKTSGCGDCHALEPGKDEGAVTLAAYGSPAWLRGLLRDPGAPSYYDAQNRMPDFGARLAPEQQDDLIAFLQALEADEPEALPGEPRR